MAANEPSVAPRPSSTRFFWVTGAIAVVLAGALIALFFVNRSTNAAAPPMAAPASDTASATWAAGAKRAPDFRLTDEHGAAVSLAGFRGRPVLVTFIDPLCRDFCPTEARRLNAAVRSFPPGERPAIVAVSVNVYGNAPRILRQDVRKWQLSPDWHWGVGGDAQLARVWKDYHVFVSASSKKIAGITVHRIVHTEAAYLVDAKGFERAVFLWPYRADAVTTAVRALGRPATS